MASATEIAFWVVALLVALALAFDFMNGFHDAANSIATVVSTGVLKPQQAVRLRGVLQLRRDLRLPPERRGDGRQGHRRARRRRPPRRVRRADRRDRLERAHLVVRHPVELVACADRRHRRRGDRQGGRRRADRRRHLARRCSSSSSRRCSASCSASLLMVLVARIFRRASPLRVDNWFRRLQLVSAGAVQPGPRRQRRAEDDRHHLDAADRLGLRAARATRRRRPG